jgi:hypothetical protein
MSVLRGKGKQFPLRTHDLDTAAASSYCLRVTHIQALGIESGTRSSCSHLRRDGHRCFVAFWLASAGKFQNRNPTSEDHDMGQPGEGRNHDPPPSNLKALSDKRALASGSP